MVHPSVEFYPMLPLFPLPFQAVFLFRANFLHRTSLGVYYLPAEFKDP